MKKLLSLVAVALLASSSILPTFAQYGGGGGGRSSSINANTPLLTKDRCPDGDLSGSMYDDTCDAEDRDLEDGSIVDGFVFYDDNQNGSFDSSEDAIQSAVVTLLDAGDRTTLGRDVTTSRGFYEFINVQPGQYTVRVELPVSFVQSLLALIVPSANAQNSYEFDVTVVEDGTVEQVNAPVQRENNTNGVSSVDADDTMDDDDMDTDSDDMDMDDADMDDDMDDADMQTPTNSLSFDNLDVSTPTTPIVVPTTLVLPTSLPNTGVSL